MCGWCLRIAVGIIALAVVSLAGGAGALSNDGGGSWAYYKDITISNSGATLSDYQVLVNLTSANFPTNAQSSGADIRFTNASGAELSYWIESWDYAGRNAKIWVNVTTIPASGSTNIRMYYGNPSATGSSNGTPTFQFFDDFNDGIINPSLWPTNVGDTSPCWYSPSCGTTDHIGATESGGVMSISHSYSNNYKLINSSAIFNIPFRFGIKIKDSGGIEHVYKSAGVGQPTRGTYDDGGNNGVNLRRQYNGNFYDIRRDGSIEQLSTTMDANTWYTYLFSASPSQVDFYNGTAHQIQTENIPNTSSPLSVYVKTWTGDNSGSATISVDYVFLAKYASPEPSVSVGAEQNYSGLVAYWRFDEGAGTLAADSSGHGNNGTLYNFNWDANGNWVDGKFGKALMFDGSNDYVEVADSLSLDLTDAMTIEAWVKPMKAPTPRWHAVIVGKGNYDTRNGYEMDYSINDEVNPAGCPAFSFVFPPSSGGHYMTLGCYYPDQWYFVSATFNGSKSRIYVNGILDREWSASPTTANSYPLRIGYSSGSSFLREHLNGTIDEVRIYNRALNASEIQAHYNASAPAKPPTLPEAVIKFNTTSKDFKVYNSETGSEAGYEEFNSKKKLDDEEKGWEMRRYTLNYSANNSLVLILKHKKEGKEAEVTIISMQYNGGAVLTAAKNHVQAEYSDDKKNSALKELEQKIEVKKQFDAEAKYSAKKGETEIKVKMDGQKEQKETRAGVVLLELVTDNGGLKLRY